MSIRHLKVKIKSLAAEARIIRHEERQVRGLDRVALSEHRRGIVRREARSAQLAYGYLRGRLYRQLERTCSTSRPGPDWAAVERLVKRYGDRPFDTSWSEQVEGLDQASAAA